MSNAAVFPFGSAIFHIAGVSLHTTLRTMLMAPYPGMQWIYVAIKQVIGLCSQTPVQWSTAGPSERTINVPVTSLNQKAAS